MMSIREALGRYPVPHSTAKLMSRGIVDADNASVFCEELHFSIDFECSEVE